MHIPEQVKRAYYVQGVLEYFFSEYESEYLDQGQMPFTPEMAQYLNECFSCLMCYPNAAGGFAELFVKSKEKYNEY